jgi:hypothetical protein
MFKKTFLAALFALGALIPLSAAQANASVTDNDNSLAWWGGGWRGGWRGGHGHYRPYYYRPYHYNYYPYYYYPYRYYWY